MRDTADPRFVGRRAELRELAARAATACAGLTRVVVIEGRPGIGKTALLRRALAELAGFRPLRADCAAGSAVDQLTRDPHRPAPAAPSGTPAQALLAGIRARLAGGGPVAVAIDNAQRIDEESAAALSSALATLGDAALLVIVAAVERWWSSISELHSVERLRRQLLASQDVSRIVLAELSATETAQLLDRFGADGAERAAASLHRYTGGHPALLSLLLDQGPAVVHTSPADLLGLFHPQVIDLLQAVRSLPTPSRDLLAAMAVSSEPWPLALAGSVAQVADPFQALEPLLESGMVEWRPDEAVAPVSVRYPLYRDVIYRSLPRVRREALHRQAATFTLGTRAWAHRVAAAGDADPALASALEQEAGRYYAAGDNEQAGRLLMWSATVTSEPAERDRRLRQAAHWWLTLRAADWGPRMEARLSPWPPSAARNLILGHLAEAAGDYAPALALLSEAKRLARVEGSAPELRSDLDLALAIVHADTGDARAERRLADGLLAAGGLPPVQRGWAECLAADAEGRLNGPPAALARLAELVPDAVIDGAPGGRRPHRGETPVPGGTGVAPGSESMRLWTRGAWRLLDGMLTEGSADLARMLHATDRAVAAAVAPMARAYLAYAHYLLGDWKAADHAVAQAVGDVNGNAVTRLRIPVHAIAACLDASAGRQDPAAWHLRAAQRWQAECGPAHYGVFPAIAAATAAQARGDYRQMLAALEPLAASQERGGTHQRWWLPLRVEALIGAGQLAAAQRALGRLAGLVSASGSLTVAWLEAWLAAAEHGGQHGRARFEEASARPAAHDDIPLHRARLEHEFGRHLMSGRRRRAAIAGLRRAHELYKALGAQPFAERCARDLEACGAPPEAPGGAAPGAAGLAMLSPRERRIAYLAAQGLTNQEIASEVFVSAKTVEYHLGNVFAKLGISSRRQLPARIDPPAGL